MREGADTAALARGILRRMEGRGLRLAVAESCTGGEVLAALTAPPGASRVVWGGAVVYGAEAKTRLAGVGAELVSSRGVVSAGVTRALAAGIRRRGAVDVGIAVTGWAGPESEGRDPVGTVYLGVSAPWAETTRRVEIDGDRRRVRATAVRELLALLAEVLENEAMGSGERT